MCLFQKLNVVTVMVPFAQQIVPALRESASARKDTTEMTQFVLVCIEAQYCVR